MRIETCLNYLLTNVSILCVLLMDDCLETSKVFLFSSDCSATIRVVDSFLRVISSGFLTVALLVMFRYLS